MALKTKIINGETWYFDGTSRITQEAYMARAAESQAQKATGKTVINFIVSLDGKLEEVTDSVNDQ